MYINKLKIKNYRSFNDFSIELKQKTLIIGENNIGKTNLISAMSLLLNNEISGLRRKVLKNDDFNFDCIQKFKKDILNEKLEADDLEFPSIEIIAGFTDFKDEDEKAIVSEWYSDDKHTEAELKYTFYCALANKIEWINKLRRRLEEEKKEDIEHTVLFESIELPISDYKFKIEGGIGLIKPDNFQLTPLKIDLLDALRDAKTELSASSSNRLLYRILSNRDDTKYTDLITNAKALNDSISSDKGELSIIKKDIAYLLDELSLETENSKNEINFSFSGLNVSDLLKKIGLEYGDKSISVENNGLGRNNLLYMSLVLSHIRTKALEADFRVVCIEEPEAHISPILQKHLSESVSSSSFFNDNTKRQIIITSHSTHISSHLDMENTVIIYRDNDVVKSHYVFDGIKNDAEGKHTKNYLKKWMNATNSIMFLSRRVIFVEGIAEQILIPKFFEIHFGKKPEKLNCQIVNVNGLAFKHFLKVIKNGYFIKSAVLTDSDKDKKTADRAVNLKRDYESDNISVFYTEESTFEKELIKFNNLGKGRNKLKETLKITRPIKYKDELEVLFTKKLDVDEIFPSIEKYKSEFAFDLLSVLDKSHDGLIIPKYITDAFDFIYKEEA
ncbi:ATP-dependent nuclease [Yersinia mollaretii]|uniref:ATP-dependent nuclease n=1 Tax=Yersinia mollaretii TaxID=33060 RepID=UPI00119DEFFE|nr:AAA family ATPase [Yersinia mollaretii]